MTEEHDMAGCRYWYGQKSGGGEGLRKIGRGFEIRQQIGVKRSDEDRRVARDGGDQTIYGNEIVPVSSLLLCPYCDVDTVGEFGFSCVSSLNSVGRNA